MRAESAFWDASAVVPLCCHQPPSATVRRLARERPRLVVWWGTLIEARSALRRLFRENALSDAGLQQATSRLDILRRSWSEILPSEEIRDHAVTLLDRHEIRAADSFQLAAALVWCNGRPRRRLVVCFDGRLADAAKHTGFELAS